MSGARAGLSGLVGRLVLVTGASGFIGRHLCLSLARLGCRVRGCARGAAPGGLRDIVEWWTVDIADESEWPALAGVEYVVHLAGLAHQIGSAGQGRRSEFQRVNAFATRRLAEAAARSSSLRRFLFVSSVAVLASSSEETVDDNTPASPEDDYGRSKLEAEHALKAAFAGKTPAWCILRPPLVYGPGNPGNMARLLALIEKGVPLPLANIHNRRSFLFVGNLIDAISYCLVHPTAAGRSLLVADQETVSTPQLIRALADCSGKRVLLFPAPLALLRLAGRLGDLVTRFVGRSVGIDSYSVARLSGSLALNCAGLNEIGWEAPFSMHDGLSRTLSND